MRKYPIDLIQYDNGGLTVRFISQNEGTVIKGNNMYKKGFHSTKWISSQDKIMWGEV